MSSLQKTIIMASLLVSTVYNAVANDDTTWIRPDSFLIPVDTIYVDNLPCNYAADEITFPTVTPKSPEASAFQKYGETEINEYTGNPAISIPLYTLSYKGIEVPLSLTYDGGGIQVSQEASWVGLGWSLNVGGCINYVCQGGNDQWLGRYGSWKNDYYRILNSNPAPYFKINSHFAEVGMVSSTQPDNIHEMLQDLKNGQAEFDYYSVNILGHSFLFFKDPYTNEYKIIGSSNDVYKIKELSNKEWEIIDVNGISYTFSEKEYSKESSWGEFISAWYLTQITIPSGGYIYFDYSKAYSYSTLPSYSQYYDLIRNYKIISAGTFASYPTDGGTHSMKKSVVWGIDKKYLSSITTDDQTIKVSLGISGRKDLPGAQRLDELSVSSPLTGQTIKKYQFDYAYFSSCLKGGNYMAYPQKDFYAQEDLNNWEDRIKLRLKLRSIKENDNTNINSLVTSFEYYGIEDKYSIDSLLPVKTSCSIDFWGYYNGKENKNPYKGYVGDLGLTNGLMPKPADCFIGHQEPLDEDIARLDGVNRFADERFMRKCTLHKIIYPTKAYTIYDFEPHIFRTKMILPPANLISVTGKSYKVEDINFVADGKHPGTGPDTQKRFNISSDSWGELKIIVQARSENEFRTMASAGANITLVRADQKPTIYKYNMSSLQVDYSKLRYETTIYNIDLASGNYVLSADLPASLGNYDFKSYPNYIGGTLTIKTKNPSNNTSTQTIESSSIGAGLRIKDISNFTSDGIMTNRINYEYLSDDGKTSGVSLVPINLTQSKHYCWATEESQSSYDVLRFSSDLIGNSSFTSSTSKGRISYSRVRKNMFDKNNKLVSYVISTYENHSAKALFNDYYQFDAFTNGNLLSREVYAANDKLYSRTNYSYNREAGQFFKCNSFLECLVHGNVAAYKNGYSVQNYGKLYQLTVYSYFAYWNTLSKVTSIKYGDNGQIEQTHVYDYNKTNHLVSTDTWYNNKDEIKYKTTYQYPCDIDDGLGGMMSARHYLSPVLSQQSLKDGKLLSTRQLAYTYKKTNYSLNPLLLLHQEKYAVGNAEPKVRMEYQYDNIGNIQCAVKDGIDKMTYLWSYDYAYPVLEIHGASYKDVINWLGSSTVTSLARKTSPQISDIMDIINKLTSQKVTCKGFLYYPGIGVKQIIDTNGYSNSYQYDNFNRLYNIKNHNGNVLNNYIYNYKK